MLNYSRHVKESSATPDGENKKKSISAAQTSWKRCPHRFCRITAANLSNASSAGGGILSAEGLTVKLAKEFGFCYGVERAIDLAYAARKYFSDVSPHTPIYLLGEIIHNPEVNDQIRAMGIQIISPKPTDDEIDQLQNPATPSSSPRSARKSAREKNWRRKAAFWLTRLAAT